MSLRLALMIVYFLVMNSKRFKGLVLKWGETTVDESGSKIIVHKNPLEPFKLRKENWRCKANKKRAIKKGEEGAYQPVFVNKGSKLIEICKKACKCGITVVRGWTGASKRLI